MKNNRLTETQKTGFAHKQASASNNKGIRVPAASAAGVGVATAVEHNAPAPTRTRGYPAATPERLASSTRPRNHTRLA